MSTIDADKENITMTMTTTTNENTREDFDSKCRDMCRHIALQLDAMADGTLYRDCFGDYCIAKNPDPSLVQVDAYDYFGDVYAVRYVLDQNLDYVGARLMVACGGPNIWVDTCSHQVELFWGLTHASYSFGPDAAYVIDDLFSEYCQLNR